MYTIFDKKQALYPALVVYTTKVYEVTVFGPTFDLTDFIDFRLLSVHSLSTR